MRFTRSPTPPAPPDPRDLEISVALSSSREARGPAAGVRFVLLGVFWVGRESEHGLAAFWEHWWCPIPLVAIVLGIVSLITMQRLRPAS